MGKVVPLTADAVLHHRHGPDKELIDSLRNLLKDARSGYLRSIDYVAINTDGGIATAWAGSADRHDEIAGVNMLAARVMARWLDALDG